MRFLGTDAGIANGEVQHQRRRGAPHRGHADRLALLPPRLPGALVDRAWLFPRMDRPVLLVVGPAGIGKTTLVTQWLARGDRPSVWLTLDEGMGDLAPFIRRLLAAIRQRAPDVGHGLEGALRWSKPPPPETLGTMLREDLQALRQPLVVVLDDFHDGHSAEIQRFLTPLLQDPAPGVQLVLISRSPPRLLPAQHGARGAIEQIGPDDLRFTGAESWNLLRKLVGQRISKATLARLLACCDGWGIGLHGAGILILNASDPARRAEDLGRDGKHCSLAALFQEMLNLLPDAGQEFLLRTSGPTALTAALAEALVWAPDKPVDALEWLGRLSAGGYFLSEVGDEGGWYRYHPLFRRYLGEQLRARYGQAAVSQVHARASDWFAQQGATGQAIRHAFAADEPMIAGTLLTHAAQAVLVDGDWPRLEDWLRMVPPEWLARDAELLSLSGWCAWLRGHDATAAGRIDRSRSRLVGLAGPEWDTGGIEAELDCIDVLRRPLTDAPASQVATLERAIPRLPNDRSFARGCAVVRLAAARVAAGDVDTALRGLYAIGDQPGAPGFVRRMALAGLVALYALAGDTIRASTAADRLLRVSTDPSTDRFGAGWPLWLAGIITHDGHDRGHASLLLRLPRGETRDRLCAALAHDPMWRVCAAAAPADSELAAAARPSSTGLHSQDMLTMRELEILDRLRRRLSNREIADELFISPFTVKRHNSNIFDKLGVGGRREAVRRAVDLGLLDAG